MLVTVMSSDPLCLCLLTLCLSVRLSLSFSLTLLKKIKGLIPSGKRNTLGAPICPTAAIAVESTHDSHSDSHKANTPTACGTAKVLWDHTQSSGGKRAKV
jgi:hypothetical protein